MTQVVNDESQETGLGERLDTWRDSAWIAKVAIRNRWAVPVMIFLGLASALAEALGVGLAVVFLFALLGQSDDVIEGGGLLAALMSRLEAVVGPNPVVVAGVFFVIILTKAMLTYANDMVTAQTLNQIAQQVRDRLHRNYVTVSYIFLQKRDTGDLLNTLATESWGVADAFYSLARIGVHLSAAAIFLIGMFALSSTIAVTSIVCAVLVFAFLRVLSRPVQRLGRETLAANQILAERMLVSLNGTRTIRAFATEPRMLRRFEAISDRVKRLAIRKERFKALLGPIGEVAGLGTLIVVALVANYSGIAVPTVIASVLLLFRLQPHLHQFEENRLVLANMGASIRNVREMLEVDDKPFPREGTLSLEDWRQSIEFDGVGFSHDIRRGPSVAELTFAIPKGKTTVIDGPSGSGKTTILNLLLRLYEPDTGRILIDGAPMDQFTRESWLRRVAIAGQDIALIETTIADNLRLGNREASDEDLRAACRTVEILEDIERLPDGFDSQIGAAGLNFSGGQRQRIGLAMALLCRPGVLILDEAMSALEPDREDRIRDRIKRDLPGLTIVAVSHRAGATATADRVIHIENGRIVENASQYQSKSAAP